MLYPLTFRPAFKERIWGGRNLQTLYGKLLPQDLAIGESWEICDRPGDISVIASGPLKGQDLHSVLQQMPNELLGHARPLEGRFPLLLKILDAEKTLSLQVHPPPLVARELKGEPKSEMWYLAHVQPAAHLFVGLKPGTNRRDFEMHLKSGTVADCFHRIEVKAGDAMFVPSGRVHAIGSGCVIFEIQQNSDTTYRVFDWNRVDQNGNPRDLHVDASIRSIDFTDISPPLIHSAFQSTAEGQVRPLVDCPWFEVEERRVLADSRSFFGCVAEILAVIRGELEVEHETTRVRLTAGSFCLLPACLTQVSARAKSPAEFLVIRPK